MSSPDRTDDFNLERFMEAQAGAYDAACRELEAGVKSSHWMWFVFPQMKGLGFSPTAQRYGIASLAEAQAYLAHPVLGPRLRHVAALMLAINGRSALEVLGSPDDMKLRSSMTLFAHADKTAAVFQAVLDRYFGGKHDPATLSLIGTA